MNNTRGPKGPNLFLSQFPEELPATNPEIAALTSDSLRWLGDRTLAHSIPLDTDKLPAVTALDASVADISPALGALFMRMATTEVDPEQIRAAEKRHKAGDAHKQPMTDEEIKEHDRITSQLLDEASEGWITMDDYIKKARAGEVNTEFYDATHQAAHKRRPLRPIRLQHLPQPTDLSGRQAAAPLHASHEHSNTTWREIPSRAAPQPEPHQRPSTPRILHRIELVPYDEFQNDRFLNRMPFEEQGEIVNIFAETIPQKLVRWAKGIVSLLTRR
jgi:hypothetical protein